MKKSTGKTLVTTTNFEHNYYSSQKHSSSNVGEYLLHNADIYNEISYKGETWGAVYQSGQSYYHGDYSTPSTKPELISEMGTAKALTIINNLHLSDFDDDIDAIQYAIEEIDSPVITTSEDLRIVYDALMDNNSQAEQYYRDIFDDNFEPTFID